MLIMDGSDQAAVHDLYEEAAYADLGTVTPELMIRRPHAVFVRIVRFPSEPVVCRDWDNWHWATAPPARAA